MPRAFRITRGEENPRKFRYLIVGRASYVVPPLKCPACGENRSLGPQYPSLDVAQLGDDVTGFLFTRRNFLPGKSRQSHLSLEEFKALEARLSPVLGADRPLSPHTCIGPFKGKAEGKFGDFAWPSFRNTLLVRQSVLREMREAGFALSAVRPALTYRRERHDPLIEVEALPIARAQESERRKTCGTCGLAKKTRGPVKIDAASFDDSLPIQRVFDCPDVILVNEALGRFIAERELLDVRLEALDLI